MELRDYLAALHRYWRTWVAMTIVGLLLAVLVIQVSPRVYRATAGVFVASSIEGTSGSQFVNQRVRSYPEIARSLTVLEPVIDELELDISFSRLRDAVTAVNPVDTSRITISVTSASPEWATEVANAVAIEFGEVMEELETSTAGSSPVTLTVTDPAAVPADPVSPDTGLLLTLGFVVGLSLGLALAIVRSRMSDAVYTDEDVRAAWGDAGAELVIHAPRVGRAATADNAVSGLIRQLEALAHERPVRLLAVSPASGKEAALTRVLALVATELSARGVPAVLAGQPKGAGHGELVRLEVAAPADALRDWRRLAAGHDGLLLVAEAGRVTAEQLRELRDMTSAVQFETVALVLLRTWRPPVRSSSSAAPRETRGAVDRTGLAVQPPTTVASSDPVLRHPSGKPVAAPDADLSQRR
ncbi:YveK family protein [Blastococcus saxobsidens]|uniref:Polysaccharide chain length determinant N-terminal domain-containing protein n=1 Tax=Blastococcus saxobsidens (strain DD2) TaxID=1146883 RepID=H6RSH9_BLASD|nr:Wzz/FepE/Etk N-terminal domain-containing protein [Blastococcus saxobsidens]CCG01730.1 conserved protein of unknown function [Blastococcus saxobsidens DD2]